MNRTIFALTVAFLLSGCAALGTSPVQQLTATNADAVIDTTCDAGPEVFPAAWDDQMRKTANGNEWGIRCVAK